MPRVADPARAVMLKEISRELARKKFAEDEVLNVPHPNLQTLDVTKRTASGSVDAILDEISSISLGKKLLLSSNQNRWNAIPVR